MLRLKSASVLAGKNVLVDGWMDSCQLGIVPFVGYESTESCLYIYPSLLFSKKKIKK